MFILGPADTCRVEFRYTWNSQEVMNTMFFRIQNGWTSEGISGWCQSLYLWWDTNLKALQSTTCTLREVYGKDLEDRFGPEGNYVADPPITGTASGDSLPNNCSLAISFRTGYTGRSFRGRNFAVGMTEAMQANSTAGASYIANLLDAYNALTTVCQSYNVEHVVASYYNNGEPREFGIATPVTSYVISNAIMDSQRRRLPGRGR